MKNSMIFLVTEGIGLNQKWKGNYLKLSSKPNINYLISGIYPWAVISNSTKTNKNKTSKKYRSVSKDTDLNFYQMLTGNREYKTYNQMFDELIQEKKLMDLKTFSDLKEHAKKHNNDTVHVFFMLSDNENHCKKEYFLYTLNALIKHGLKPKVHIVADGQDDKPYSFSDHIIEFSKFARKRLVPIVTIAGRNNVFIKNGHNYLENAHVFDYFKTICGLGENSFRSPSCYASDCLANKVADCDIEPAFTNTIADYHLKDTDSVLFLDSDPDSFSCIASMIKTEENFSKVFISSMSPIYGTKCDSLFFKQDVQEEEFHIANVMDKENKNTLVISLNHKKGFINKFYGEKKLPNVDRKIISTSFTQNEYDYQISASKVLIDKAIKSIGKYDLIIIHAPMIAEAAKTSDLKLLNFAIETFDKNLGRLINYCKATGNIIAFSSAYGSAEKMLNKRLNIIPYVKNSTVPFVFTNGDLSSKKLVSDFVGIHATMLISLGIENINNEIEIKSLIKSGFNKDKIRDRLADDYEVWRDEFALEHINNFENTKLNFYSEFNKDQEYINEKRQYIILKEIVKLHDNVFTTRESRQKIYKLLLDYVEYNNIDFMSFPYNYIQMLTTLFDADIKLQKLSKLSNKYFDNKIWNTNIKRNSKWIEKIKPELELSVSRKISKREANRVNKFVTRTIDCFLFFERFIESETKVISTNDAHKICAFYESVAEEVKSVFQEYVEPKLHDPDEEMDEEEMKKERQYHGLVTYFKYFLEVLDLVNEFKDRCDDFNNKYLENYKYFKEHHITDVYKKNYNELNWLTRKIVTIYKGYHREMNQFHQSLQQSKKQKINRFNNQYALKYNQFIASQTYEGEFLEGVDIRKQEGFEKEFLEKVQNLHEFDHASIDKPEVVETQEDIELLESVVEQTGAQEDPETIELNQEVEKMIKIWPEYDLTEFWTKNRLEDIKNKSDSISSIVQDAQEEIKVAKKLKNAESRIDQYDNLSQNWKDKVGNKITKENQKVEME